jgi:hypothetical protein
MSGGDDGGGDGSEPLARDVYRTLVDARILDAVDARLAQELTHDWTVVTAARTPRLHVEPEAWGTGFIVVGRERDNFAPQLQEDLRELTPQASLRDLYRPVMQSRWVEREPLVELDPGALRSLADARAARQRDPLPRFEPLAHEMVIAQDRHRALLAERWQAHLPDDKPRTAAYVPPDMEPDLSE